MKIGPVDHEIALLNLKKKLTQAKYIARSAGLPSGLNKYRIHQGLHRFGPNMSTGGPGNIGSCRPLVSMHTVHDVTSQSGKLSYISSVGWEVTEERGVAVLCSWECNRMFDVAPVFRHKLCPLASEDEITAPLTFM